jgi:hypothetical protein
MPSALADDITARLMALTTRLETADSARRDTASPGAMRVHADAFLGATSQHLAGVVAVLVPALSQVEGGQGAVRELVENIKDLERSLVLVKARLYGQAQNARRPWNALWRDVREQLAKVAAAEEAITMLLERHVGPGRLSELQTALVRAIVHAQTRPHPYLPHLGILGRVARRMCATTDRVWDELEGRVTVTVPRAS